MRTDLSIESPRRQLLRLLAAFNAGTIEPVPFCAQFEHLYNMELDKRSLSSVEAAALGPLFEEVIWYSPFPEERAKIPNYRNEADIARAVGVALRCLGPATP